MQKINEIFEKYELLRDPETIDPNSDPLYNIGFSDEYAHFKFCIRLLADLLDELENTREKADKHKAALREIRNILEKENRQ